MGLWVALPYEVDLAKTFTIATHQEKNLAGLQEEPGQPGSRIPSHSKLSSNPHIYEHTMTAA
jgi:hypothetical protein